MDARQSGCRRRRLSGRHRRSREENTAPARLPGRPPLHRSAPPADLQGPDHARGPPAAGGPGDRRVVFWPAPKSSHSPSGRSTSSQTFADQAVIAIANVNLFEEVQAKTRDLTESLQQQTATADVLKVISRSAFDLQTVFETLIKSRSRVLSARYRGSIFLREGDVFPLKAASSIHPRNSCNTGQRQSAARRPRLGHVAGHPVGEGRNHSRRFSDPEIQMPASSLARIRAVLGVPMLRDDKVDGVLVLTRPEPGPFTASQIALVQTFADQAVIAVENVRLFDETAGPHQGTCQIARRPPHRAGSPGADRKARLPRPAHRGHRP